MYYYYYTLLYIIILLRTAAHCDQQLNLKPQILKGTNLVGITSGTQINKSDFYSQNAMGSWTAFLIYSCVRIVFRAMIRFDLII